MYSDSTRYELYTEFHSWRAMKPAISICIPTHNGERFLRECVQSALDQTFTEFELLIVDDASVDSTFNLAKQCASEDSRVRVCRNERNLGLVQNWNRCAEHAVGEWIKFLHQDDLLAKNCLTDILEAARPDVDLVVARRELRFETDATDDTQRIMQNDVAQYSLTRYFPSQKHISGEQFARVVLSVPDKNCIGEPTFTLIRRSAFRRFGFFNPSFVNLCDWEFCARVAVNTGLCYVDKPLAVFRVHSGAVSAHNRSQGYYRAVTIDGLIVRHEIAYSRHFYPVRLAARKDTPPRNLKMELADAVRQARREALCGSDPQAALGELRRAMKNHPRLLCMPPTYLLRWAISKTSWMAEDSYWWRKQ